MVQGTRGETTAEAPPAAPNEGRRAEAHARLLDWYAAEGRSHLPWRHTRDPYAILVSEVMLQQTQVERVLPKYREFLDKFPTLKALADAPTGEVIKAWATLGYNMRAVRLHQIARQAVAEYGGRLPDTLDGLLSLTGVGRYTAGAVACFAFGLPVATVDTNIRRVLWRVFRGIEPVAWPAGERATRDVLALAEWALPPERAYDWQQALMDLGATVCLARRPLCERCPLRACCAAFVETARDTLFPSGEALVRLRDERHAAEHTAGYGTSGDNATRRVAESRAAYDATRESGNSGNSGNSGSPARTVGPASRRPSPPARTVGPASRRPSPPARQRDSSSQNGHSSESTIPDSGKIGNAPRSPSARRATRREPFEQSSRYFRGRIVAALRDLPTGDALPLDTLGPRVKDGYTPADAQWLLDLARGLARDGLAIMEQDMAGAWRVRLP